MNNFSMKIKKIVGNKNIVTALCFILIGIVLIIGYQWRINEATAPIKVPYALKTISPQTEITSDMVGTMSVASDAINKDLIYVNKKNIVGKYTNLESTVYEGSFFYRGSVVSKDELPTAALFNVPEGNTLLYLNVDMKTSYYNSLVPGDYFDLYVRTIEGGKKEKTQVILAGKLINQIKILAVKTAEGKNVFGTDEDRVPAGILFSVPEEQAILIQKADYFTEFSDIAEIQFVIIPRGQKYKSETGDEVKSNITSEDLEKYINEKTKDIDVNQIKNNQNGQVTPQ